MNSWEKVISSHRKTQFFSLLNIRQELLSPRKSFQSKFVFFKAWSLHSPSSGGCCELSGSGSPSRSGSTGLLEYGSTMDLNHCKRIEEDWSRIHERTISLRFLSIILRVHRLEVSIYNVYITNQFQTTFATGGRGVESVSITVDCE